MSLSRSRSTGELVFCTGSRCSPAPSPVRDRRQLGRAGRARLAVDERLADQRLRADRAVGVRVERREARRSWMSSITAAFLSRRHVQRVDLAHLRAGDLHVLARHERDAMSKIARTCSGPCPRRRRAPRRRTPASRGTRDQRAALCRSAASWAGRARSRVAVWGELSGRGTGWSRQAPAGWRRPGSGCRFLRLEPVEAVAPAGSP